jgi:ribose transport system permease protein
MNFAMLREERGTVLAFAAAIALVIAGGIYRPSFVQPENLATLLLLASFIGIAAAGQTFVVLIGGIDLSVPWVLNAMAILLTTMSLGQNERAWWAVPLALLAGAMVGALNGLGIVLFEIPPVVMTLAMNGIMEGLVLGLTGGFTCNACNSYAPPAVVWLFTGKPIPGVANGLLLWALIAVGVGIYALGNNARATYLSGIDTRAVTVIVYALSGFFAGIAGFGLAAFGQQATLGMGDPFLFDSIAAVVIGGASILGGKGNYWGSVAGAIFLIVLRSVLQEYNIGEAGRSIASGVVILIALLLYGRQRSEF